MTKHKYNLKYRPDIDGLRGIAAISAVSFHAFPSILPGGFLGVDIFFVISGYLISGIIFQNIDQGTFSIAEFYSRRVRRIFPALIIILYSVLFIGWFLLFPEELYQLSRHTISSAEFIQNFILANESGYFDHSSEVKPLLHIWSLAVEEQFYFIWPLLLSLSGRIKALSQRKYSYLIITILVFISSLVFSIYTLDIDSQKKFYLPHYRIWELALGGVLAWTVLYLPTPTITSKKCVKNSLSSLGIGIILWAFTQCSHDTFFPNKIAQLLPIVFSAALIIWAGTESFVNKKILSNNILIWFGLISFPLYLWHWPLLSFAIILSGEMPPSLSRLILVLLGIIFAWLTYYFVEKPIRLKSPIKTFFPLFLLLLLVIICGEYISSQRGLKNRNIALNNLSETGFDGWDQGNLVNGCGIPKESEKKFANCSHDKRDLPTIALLGDSKAAALAGGLVRHSDEGTRILLIGGNGKFGSPHPFYLGDFQPSSLAGLAAKAIIENKNIKKVIMTYSTGIMYRQKNNQSIADLPNSNDFDYSLNKFRQYIQYFINGGKKVVLTVDNPTLPDPMICLDRKSGINQVDSWLSKKRKKSICSITYEKHMEYSKKYLHILKTIQAEFPDDVSIFDTVPLLCDMAIKTCSTSLHGKRLYSYTNHISDLAAGIIAKELMPFLKTIK